MKKIVVATPCYDGKVSYHYMNSMIEFHLSNKNYYTGSSVIGDSLVTRARNILISQFYYEMKEFDFDYLLWLDDDVYIPVEWVDNMVDLGLKVVGSPYPLKVPITEFGVQCVVTGKVEHVKDFLYEVDCAGTGALLMHKDVVSDLIENSIKEKNFYFDKQIMYNAIFNIFEVGIDNERYLSEDWFLCKKIQQLGYKIYVDTSKECRHDFSYRKAAILNKNKDYVDMEERLSTWTPLLQ